VKLRGHFAHTFASMQPYRNLTVWRFAHELAMDIRRLTLGMPRTHNIDLIDQIRRSSQSIPANIAEGCGRQTNRDFAKFLQIAIGSSTELEYHLQFCADADIADKVECDARIADVVRVRKMLTGLMKRVLASDGRSVPVRPKAQ
jgi:four helix bundle protein